MTWAIVKPRDAWLRQATDAWAALAPQAPRARSYAPSRPSTMKTLPGSLRPWWHSCRARSARSYGVARE